MPLGLRLLFPGIGMLLVSSIFAQAIPGTQNAMGLLQFIGFGMPAGGLVILVAPAAVALGKVVFTLLNRPVKEVTPHVATRPKGEELPGYLHPQPTPTWTLLLQSLEWKVFENLCADYLRETGFRSEIPPPGT